MLLYALLYVINFVMAIPLVIVVVSYWDDDLEDGKHRAQQLCIRYIQVVSLGVLVVWGFGQVISWFGWQGGAGVANLIIGMTLAIVVILLFSVVYAVLLEKAKEASYARQD